MSFEYIIEERQPAFEEYYKLCLSVGWDSLNFDAAKQGIKNSVYAIVVMYGDEAVGMARVIGDGSMYFYLQDIVVAPAHQQKGLGKLMLEKIFDYLNEHAPVPAFVGLFATAEGEGLYEKFGFQVPGDMRGMFTLTRGTEK